MAILNGDTPVDGSYREHFKDLLGEDDEGYDSDDSCSNAHENVRKDARILFGTSADHVPSPRSVKLSPTREFLSPLVPGTILTMRISKLSTSPAMVRVQSPRPARQPQVRLCQPPNVYELRQAPASGKNLQRRAAENLSNRQVV